MQKTICALLACALLAGCARPIDIPGENAPTPAPSETLALIDPGFTERDERDTYENATTIRLADGAIAADGPGVSIAGSVVTIVRDGTYRLTGSLSAGQVRVQLPGKEDKAQLVLDNVSIACPDGPALYVLDADKVFLTLAPESENVLSDGAEYALEPGEDEPNAALFSKDDLTINGTGALHVQGYYKHGILSKDSLAIVGGNFTIEAPEDALRGRDSIAVLGGRFAIIAGGDGLRSNNDEDASRGWIVLEGGEFVIAAGDDGLQAETELQISGGVVAIEAGNKGLRAEGGVTIAGGEITIERSEEGIEAMRVLLADGRVSITATDDGINATAPDDAATTTEPAAPAPPPGEQFRPEGAPSGPPPEGFDPNAAPPAPPEGGQPPAGFDPNAQPPGGAPAGPPAEESDGSQLRISGGVIHVDAGGDGLDSNGTLSLEGGVLTIDGPTSGADGALDSSGPATISGGALLGLSLRGMGQRVEGSLTTIALEAVHPAGTKIELRDAAGHVLLAHTAGKEFDTIAAAAPGMAGVYLDGVEVE